MQCYTEIVPPTGITHCLGAAFTSSDANNLIVARTSVLQIFTHKHLNNNNQDTKLVLVAEYELSGTVTSLGKVKLLESKSGADGIIVSFRDAKLALLEWDPVLHSISTISIHYYENHDLLQCPWIPNLSDCVCHLTVDPSSRCAAYNFGVNNLAVIPFYQTGDDLAMDDFDELDEGVDARNPGETTANGDAEHKTPYAPSFVLPLTALDPSLLHPVDMAFLYEYREPTIGILYAATAPSANMAVERKDALIYAVYTLDIEQRASTTLLSIQNLPNDLYKVISLPLPVGGALLLGGNEVVHIDQGGKISAIGVNEFAKECSSLSMVDHSHLKLRLEGGQAGLLGTSGGEMLLALSDGSLALLTFLLDGRSVSALSLRIVESHETEAVAIGRASSMACTGPGQVFIGSEGSDSVLCGPSRQSNLRRLNSKVQQNGGDDLEEEDEDMDDNDDDLYADTNTSNGHSESLLSGGLRVLDRLTCIGPINDMTFGRPSTYQSLQSSSSATSTKTKPELEIAMACGHGKGSALSFLQREVVPQTVHRIKHENVVGLWSVKTTDENSTAKDGFDDTIILSIKSDAGPTHSSLLTLKQGAIEIREGTEFDGNVTTITVGRLAASNHTVQVAVNDIRVYDADFGLSQIFPIVDEDSGEIAQVLMAMVVEPYVMFIKDDQAISVLKADRNGELDEMDLPSNIPTSGVVYASLYHDATDFFKTSTYSESTVSEKPILLSILSNDGSFGIYPLTNPRLQIFQYNGLLFLPPVLSSDTPIPKHWKNQDGIAEVVLSDLGDEIDQSPYLTVRNTTGDIVLYEAHAVDGVKGVYRFHKIDTKMADVVDDDDYEPTLPMTDQSNQQLQPMDNIEGFRLVFVTKRNPAIIVKTASSRPRIYRFGESVVKHVSSFNDATNSDGFIYVDSNSSLVTARLPPNTLFGISDYPIRRFQMGEEITKLAYHPTTNTYLVSTVTPTAFQLPQDDEWHPEWTEESTTFLPSTSIATLKLISATTYATISSHRFDPNEHVLALKCIPLSVSEETHEIQSLVAVGTAVTKGENAVTRGNINVFSIASVNPDPFVPESDLKLKLIIKEDVRGSVSVITSIGSQGFLLASQGQKAMVRGLKEDKTLLPVAFMDIRFHLSVARELTGTGLTIMGDAFSGLWLMGYSEEPYKMQLLARDTDNPNVISADFLPDGKNLYVISADGDGVLRILEYDPENPKTERGSKLLLRSTFNTGSLQTTMTLVPRTPSSSESLNIPLPPQPQSLKKRAPKKKQNPAASDSDSGLEVDDSDSDGDSELNEPSANHYQSQAPPTYKTQQILLTSQTGAVSLLVPLYETTYRRLSTLQNILTTQLDHVCGLNPRAYREVETDGIGGRGVIDGNTIRRWLSLSSWHKGVMAGKVGGNIWDLRSDIEGTVTSAGLGYI